MPHADPEVRRAYHRDYYRRNGERMRAASRERHRADVDRSKNYQLVRRYGLTVDQYSELLISQGGVCAVCSLPETVVDPRTGQARFLAVDHCHETGLVRGLLCQACNNGLGRFRDDISLLLSAARCLEVSRA